MSAELTWKTPTIREVEPADFGLQWEIHCPDQPSFHLRAIAKTDYGLYGEVYGVYDDNEEKPARYRWHCKVSDFRGYADTAEAAKAELFRRLVRHKVFGG